MTISTIRTALVDALDDITGLHAAAYLPDQIAATPLAVVSLRSLDYDLVFGRGADTYMFVVSVYTSKTALPQEQALLDTFCEPSGSTSIKTQLETAAVATAAGVDYVRVRNVQGVDVRNVGDLPYLVLDFELEVVL